MSAQHSGFRRRAAWAVGAALLFCAAFLFGAGAAQAAQQAAGRHIPTVLESGDGGRLLDESLKYVSIETELHAGEDGRCEARIQNKTGSGMSARVRITRNATGERLYESGLIDPGHYVEEIKLSARLRPGWYPCRVVWEFYRHDTLEPVGKAAQSAVLVVQG